MTKRNEHLLIIGDRKLYSSSRSTTHSLRLPMDIVAALVALDRHICELSMKHPIGIILLLLLLVETSQCFVIPNNVRLAHNIERCSSSHLYMISDSHYCPCVFARSRLTVCEDRCADNFWHSSEMKSTLRGHWRY